MESVNISCYLFDLNTWTLILVENKQNKKKKNKKKKNNKTTRFPGLRLTNLNLQYSFV